jgi:hypothetical protein
VSVKLVAETGVGTIAAGVAKGKADGVLISGHDGGTGASPLASIKHAGLPWEIGLAETQQTLVLNDLRGRIRVQTDGGLKTGRDVVIAALLGADEFGFSTAPLVALGCILMRVCHLNTCPVGIATQNPELRKRFAGQPEHVVNYLFFVAEEVREILAKLGFRKLEDAVGRMDRLDWDRATTHWKAKGLDFSQLLHKPDVPFAIHHCEPQQHALADVVDMKLLEMARPALRAARRSSCTCRSGTPIAPVGTILGSDLSRKYAEAGLPEDTITIHFSGSAGQSFGAFVPRGMTLWVHGDTNDFCGKGLSGGKLGGEGARRLDLRSRTEHRHGQRGAVRRDGRRGVLPGRRGRALLRPQQRRARGRRRRRRSRLRVHDRRPRGDPRRDRAQLRRRHVRRLRATCSTSTAPSRAA